MFTHPFFNPRRAGVLKRTQRMTVWRHGGERVREREMRTTRGVKGIQPRAVCSRLSSYHPSDVYKSRWHPPLNSNFSLSLFFFKKILLLNRRAAWPGSCRVSRASHREAARGVHQRVQHGGEGGGTCGTIAQGKTGEARHLHSYYVVSPFIPALPCIRSTPGFFPQFQKKTHP